MRQQRDRRFEHVFDGLAAHAFQASSADRLSRASGLSAANFRRLFQANIGALPSSYLRDLRLGQAYKDLMFTDEPVIEISTRSGFAFQSAFTRAFRERFDAAPTQIRANAVHFARRWRSLQRPGEGPGPVRMSRTMMLRRYEIDVPLRGLSPNQGEGMGTVPWSHIVAQVAEHRRSLRYFKGTLLQPNRANRSTIAKIYVEPAEIDKSEAVREFFSDRIALQPVFEEETYLSIATDKSTADAGAEGDLLSLVAAWVRNQVKYDVDRAEWVERVVLHSTGSVERDILVPLRSKRPFEHSHSP